MLESGLCAGKSLVNRGLCFGEMAFANRESVEGLNVAAFIVGFRFGSEIVFEILPVIAAFEVGAQGAAGIITAMHHAIFATRIARHAINHAVFVPIYLIQHL